MDYKYPDTCLIVFCKAPVAGQVKTRLMPDKSADEAALIHRFLTTRLLTLLSKSALCPVELWCSPNSEDAFFDVCRRQFSIAVQTQYGTDLGERMDYAIDSTLDNYQHCLLMGSDCPSLGINELEKAIQALMRGADVALAPAEDGGYTMIGMSEPHSALFENIPWGTDQVLALTETLIKSEELSYYKTAMQWDIDTIDDWQRFCRQHNINI